jgi:hypothetical protein
MDFREKANEKREFDNTQGSLSDFPIPRATHSNQILVCFWVECRFSSFLILYHMGW